MLIIGAGGHALEVLDVLKESANSGDEVFFFDDVNVERKILKEFKVLKSISEVRSNLPNGFQFIIGVGQPAVRKKFYEMFSSIGGNLYSIKSSASFLSEYHGIQQFDVMKNCFIGPDTFIGIGTLINTGAQIHHQSQIGEFTEISPRAVILGNVEIGSYSRISANSTILPTIKIGSNVTVGAGSVVTKNLPGNCMAAGVPAVVIKQLLPIQF
ncbi:MAG: acetyltransferase [Ferruginibacter sp.]